MTNNTENITEINLRKKLKEITNLVNIWKPRCLPIFGKIILIKSKII